MTEFSIYIKNLPDILNTDELESFLEQAVPKNEQDIAKTYLIYDLSEYNMLYQKKIIFQNLLLEKKINLKLLDEKPLDDKIKSAKQQELNQEIDILTTEISTLNAQIEELLKNFQKKSKKAHLYQSKNSHQNYYSIGPQDLQDKVPFSGKIIFTFNSKGVQKKIKKFFTPNLREKFAFKFYKYFPSLGEKYLQKFRFKDRYIKIAQAPDPSDILWTSIGSRSSKKSIRLKSDLICYLCMIVALAVLVLMKTAIRRAQFSLSSILAFGLNFVAATFVALANVIIGIIVRRFASKELRATQTTYFVQVGRKLSKMFAINMLLTIFFANQFSYFIIPQVESQKVIDFPLDVVNLVNEYFFLFITNSYISSAFSIFDIVWGVRLLKRQITEKRLSKNTCTLSQQQANELFEGHPIDMALRYANVLKNIQYASAIAAIVPIGQPMCLLGLFIVYWVDKYLLLRRFVCSNFISWRLPREMMKLMQLSTVYFSIGNLLILFFPIYDADKDIFSGDYKPLYLVISFAGFVIAMIFQYVPFCKDAVYRLYFQLNNKKYRRLQDSSYNALQEFLIQDYDLYHPIFKDHSIEKIQKMVNN